MLRNGSRIGLTAILWVALMLACMSTGFAAANPFTEVPADHWSYQALSRLQALGLIDRPLEGSSNLAWRLTRVEMAIEVAGVLDKLVRVAQNTTDSLVPRLVDQSLDAIAALYNEKVADAQALSESDVRLLEDLVVQFGPELEALGYRFGSEVTARSVGLDALARALGRFQISGLSRLQQRQSIRAGLSSGEPTLMPRDNEQYRLRLGYLDRASKFTVKVLESDYGFEPLVSDPIAVTVYPTNLLTRGGIPPGVEELNPHNGWSELALVSAEGLQGLQAGVKLGQLGSTVLFAQRETNGVADYLTGLDSSVHLDRLTVGATVIRSAAIPLRETKSDDPEEGTLASVQGTYRLTPGVVVTAGLAGSIWGDRDASLVRIGGLWQLSDHVSVEAVYRLQEEGFRPALASEYDSERTLLDLALAFDTGDIRWTAGVDQATWVEGDNNPVRKTTASLGLMYPVNELTVLRASREEVLQGGEQQRRETSTALGIDFFVPQMNLNVSLGYGIALFERWTGEASERAIGRTQETALGLEYQLPSGTIALRYKVIDASGEAVDTNEPIGSNYGAEFTIRF